MMERMKNMGLIVPKPPPGSPVKGAGMKYSAAIAPMEEELPPEEPERTATPVKQQVREKKGSNKLSAASWLKGSGSEPASPPAAGSDAGVPAEEGQS